MTAPEKVKSGIEGLDRALSNIRLGDNVVWRLKSLDLFPLVASPFVKQAVSDGRNLIYLRFAPHEEFVPEQSGVKRYELDPEQGFDAFTLAVHDIIVAEGPRAFYVFDSLSALQVAWNTDAHTGDFFHATCPFLYELDTVAYFPLLRSRHSANAISNIQKTTQLMLDLFASEDSYYIHPLKVYKRHSQTMFLPHSFDPASGKVLPLLDRESVSRYYAIADREKALR